MRLVLCDDNRILCEALAVALEARGHQVLATATESTTGIAEVERHRPDVCLLDLRFPDPPDGFGAARVIRDRCPETAVLVLSCLADPAVLVKATQLGVAGVLRKDQNVDHIAGAWTPSHPAGCSTPRSRRIPGGPAGIATNRSVTSRRGKEVLRRIVAGQSTAQMTREMGVTASTLRTYVKSMFVKLGAHTRLEAAVLATREDLLGEHTA